MIIHKYRLCQNILTLTDSISIPMPKGARLLSVGVQDGVPVVWAVVDLTAAMSFRYLALIGTGNLIELMDFNPQSAPFIGTVQLDMGGMPLVLHVFDQGEQ